MTQLLWIVGGLVGMAALGMLLYGVFLTYVLTRYGKHIFRIFEEKPHLLAPPAPLLVDAEEVEFRSHCGRRLVGSYLRCYTPSRRGVVLFCHEFLGRRQLVQLYLGYLRDQGFDLFTFDFGNEGDSDSIPGYDPLHWVTHHEVADALGALDYLRQRPDADPRGVGVFGVSKGGAAALVATARHRYALGVVTDSAFPIHATVAHYATQWVHIYVQIQWLYRMMPRIFYDWLATTAVILMQYRRKVSYPRVERSAWRLRPKSWLLIHGERDKYIRREIAQTLFAAARQPKEFWLVPKAKHNCSLQVAGEEYRQRVSDFFSRLLAPASEKQGIVSTPARGPELGPPAGLLPSPAPASKDARKEASDGPAPFVPQGSL